MITKISTKVAVGLVVALTLIFVMGGTALAQDSVAAARDLYASASYSDALTMLNRMEQGNKAHPDGAGIAFYRGLCLLALGNSAEAAHAFEALVSADPTYRPVDAEVPPRVQAALSDVRRHMLPAIVQQQYADAKAAYDRKEFAAAEYGFRRTLRELSDPDIAISANQPPLADLKTLATGFHDLSASAVSSALAPVAPSAPPPLVVQPAVAAPVRQEARIRTADDNRVLAPVVLNQKTPFYPGKILVQRTGTIEVVVDETGAVESAAMRTSVEPRYDQILLAAARDWKYRPATLDGVPTKFRKLVQVTLAP